MLRWQSSCFQRVANSNPRQKLPAPAIIEKPELKDLSGELMKIGDGWREISLFSARIGKNRDLGPDKLKQLSEMIYDRADVEERFFKSLSQAIK